MTYDLDRDAVSGVKAILDAMFVQGSGIESILQPVRQIADKHGWLWFGLSSKRDFTRKCIGLASNYSYHLYSKARLTQLQDGNFGYWVYLNADDCAVDHSALNGLSLPPEHPFWSAGFPPLSWDCSCYVTGAKTAREAERLGGDLSIVPPDPAIFGEDSDEPLTWRSRSRLSQDEGLFTLLRAIIDLDTGDAGKE